MLYLFNSAARTEYVKNVLNTLNFPSGAVNMYQYSVSNSNYNYVDNSANPSISHKFVGVDVLIVYMDRDKTPFVFYPLRTGTLVDTECREGRVYYYVKMGEYVSTNNIQEFNQDLRNLAGSRLYCETLDGATGQVTKHGYFAFLNTAVNLLCNNSGSITQGEDKWLETAQQIKDCKKFKDENNCVFTKVTLKKGNHIVLPTCKKRVWYYKLSLAKKYTMEIDYYLGKPSLVTGPNRNEINSLLSPDKDALQISNSSQAVGTQQGVLKYPLSSKSFGENSTKMSFSMKDDTICFAQKPIFYKTGIKLRRVLALVFLSIVLFLCHFISGLNVEASIKNLSPLEATGDIDIFQRFILWWARIVEQYDSVITTGAAGLATGCTLIVAKFMGKKEEK